MNRAEEIRQHIEIVMDGFTGSINNWIDAVLKNRFLRSYPKREIRVGLPDGIPVEFVVLYLESQGFSAKYVSPNSPLSEGYLQIILPPGEE